MDFHKIIADRRDGRRQDAGAFRALAEASAHRLVPDYQLAAWLMAAYLHPLDLDETANLTMAMAASGDRLDLSDLPRPWVDKHSTGGVGDKTTLALLPILAACGLTVVKMSGRGLGITGGTVDKLASIPGFRIDLSPAEMVAQAKQIGLALTGQTPDLAPADKTLYALRDATETVASVPLIVSSILSKKIAGGAEILGLDVKCGSGAFMRTLGEAKQLADWLIEVATRCGLSTHITISDMDQPLGRCAGNALEVREAFDLLGAAEPSGRFCDLVLHLASETLVAVGKSDSMEGAQAIAAEAIASGRAELKARQWVEAQGGTWGSLPRAPFVEAVSAPAAGWVARVDAESVGRAVVELGGGRQSAEDEIDPAVGVETLVQVGAHVAAGQPVFLVHANTMDHVQTAARRLTGGLDIQHAEVVPVPVVLEVRR